MTTPPAVTVDLDALRRLAEAATPGPWSSNGQTVLSTVPADMYPHMAGITDDEGWFPACLFAEKSDAVFFAAANPGVALTLIAEVEQARKARQDAQAVAWRVKFNDLGVAHIYTKKQEMLRKSRGQDAVIEALFPHPDPELADLRTRNAELERLNDDLADKVKGLEAQLACVARITAERRGEVAPLSDDRIGDLLRELGCGGLTDRAAVAAWLAKGGAS